MAKLKIYDVRITATILILSCFSLALSAPHHELPDIVPVPLAHICVHIRTGTTTSDLPPVLMLHGITGSKETWTGIYEVIATQTKRKVCVLDARNHGDSPWTDHFSIDAMVADLDYFMEQHNISKSILIGHSMGGLIAMKLALSKPEKVDKLFVEDISPRLMSIDAKESSMRYKVFLDSLSAIPEGADLQTAKRAVLDFLRPKKPGDDDVSRDKAANSLPLIFEDGVFKWKTNFDAILAAFQTKESFNTEFTGVYNGNALFIYGSESPFKVYDDKELILKLFPKAQFVAVEGASHVIHPDFPQFMKEVLKFINDHQ